MNACALCNALKHLQSIDDAQADEILLGSDMSTWCKAHLRAWLDSRSDPARGRARLASVLKRAGHAL